MNRPFEVSKNTDKTISIRINNDKMLSFKIDPDVFLDLAHYHNKIPEKEITEIIIDDLNHFYNFTDSEIEEYTEILKQILED